MSIELTDLEKEYIEEHVGKHTLLKISIDTAINVDKIKEYCVTHKINTKIPSKSVSQIYYTEKYGLSIDEMNYIYKNILKNKKELAQEIGISENLLRSYLKEYRKNKNSTLHYIIKGAVEETFETDEDIVDYVRKQLETKSTIELGDEFGVNHNTISNYCYLNEIRIVQKASKGHSTMTNEEIQRNVKYLRKWYGIRNWHTICKDLNRGKTTLLTLIKRYSIKKNGGNC